MKLLNRDLLLIIFSGVILLGIKAQDPLMPVSPALMKKSSQACLNVAKEPYFSLENVIGKPWRMYYTWNLLLREACVDAHCQPATPEVIERIHYDMNQTLSEHPDWEIASLLMTIGKNRQEILLFPDTEIPGRFRGVTYFVSELLTRQIPMLKLQLKLLRQGRYLLFLDCHVGIAWLGSRFDEPPFRMDIESMVSELMPYLGEGYHACTNASNSYEIVAVPENKNTRPQLMESDPNIEESNPNVMSL